MSKSLNQLVEESGMLPHLKTLQILRESGWSVLVSPYYHDTISDSIREADLIAEKQFLSADRYSQASIQINLQLFIECKFIKNDVVFWFDKIDSDKSIKALEREIELEIAHNKNGDIVPTSLHYFKNDNVAKVFSTSANKDDVIYKAMNQCLHSLINSRRTGKKPIFKPFFQNREVFGHTVQYPLIVCDNFHNLNELELKAGDQFEAKSINDNFVLETNYRDDYFLIDLVDLKSFKSFLNILENDAKAIVAGHVGKEH